MLNSKNPAVEYYNDFIPGDALSLQARQLLFSASKAYVFGGMGSWNDNIYSNSADKILPMPNLPKNFTIR